jgi:type I restriction enzyme S subunit
LKHITPLWLGGTNGTTMVHITKATMEKKKIYIPKSVEYQKSIATILLNYDNLIENNNKRIKILEQMAENLYKEWFVRFRFPNYENTEFENGIPKCWEIIKLKSCVKRLPFNRLYKATELLKEGSVIVIDQSSDEYLGFHNNEPSHYADYENPIILFGDHSCKFNLMCKNFSLGENVIPFCSNDISINNYFLYYSIHKLITTEEYKRHWGRLIGMKIFIPPVTLQNRFAEQVVVVLI